MCTCRGLAVVLAFAAFSAGAAAQPPDQILARALRSRSADARWPRRPLLDVATEIVGAPAARARTSLTGRGATVCVVDTGLDLAHADFRDADDRTRVSRYLDLRAPPRPDAVGEVAALQLEFDAAVWDGASLDAARAAADPQLPRDSYGHGTSVASAAAGDDAPAGVTAPGPRAGVAPEAALAIVAALRPGEPGFHDEDLIRGARFCAAIDGGAGRMVIVLSVGGHDGAHDGTEILERALVELSETSGLPVVVAAGNEGADDPHAAGLLAPREVVTVPLRIPAPAGPPGLPRHLALVITMRDEGEARFAIAPPDGGPRTPFFGPGDTLDLDTPAGHLAVDATMPARASGDRPIYVVLAGGADLDRPLRGGTWSLIARGPGRFDVWIAGADLGATLSRPRFDGPLATAAETVSIPATAPGLIAAGALVSRASFEMRAVEPGAVDGHPAPYSGRGPTRAGAPKPDLIAPGGFMVVALSGDLVDGDPQNIVGGSPALLAQLRAGPDRIVLRGTSLACPLVAGTLALALQQARARPEDDRRLLMATASPPEGAWSPAAGAGTLDVDRFLAMRSRTLPDGPADPAGTLLATTRTSAALDAEPFWLVARASDAAGQPLGRVPLTITSRYGPPITAELRSGIALVPLTLEAAAVHGDDFTVRAGATRLGELHVSASTPPLHPMGGGCSITAGPQTGIHGAFGMLATLSLLLWNRRRRGLSKGEAAAVSVGRCASSRSRRAPKHSSPGTSGATGAGASAGSRSR